MTRKEWMKKHYPPLVQDHFIGGVQGCPGAYSMLALVDKSISRMNSCLNTCEKTDIHEACARCWNQEMEVSQ